MSVHIMSDNKQSADSYVTAYSGALAVTESKLERLTDIPQQERTTMSTSLSAYKENVTKLQKSLDKTTQSMAKLLGTNATKDQHLTQNLQILSDNFASIANAAKENYNRLHEANQLLDRIESQLNAIDQQLITKKDSQTHKPEEAASIKNLRKEFLELYGDGLKLSLSNLREWDETSSSSSSSKSSLPGSGESTPRSISSGTSSRSSRSGSTSSFTSSSSSSSGSSNDSFQQFLKHLDEKFGTLSERFGSISSSSSIGGSSYGSSTYRTRGGPKR